MAQTWSIMIKGAVPAKFNADVFGTDPGKPLKAQIGDLVSWNNQTNDIHQIQVNDSGGKPSFTTKEIEAFKSSSPGYVTAMADVHLSDVVNGCIKAEGGSITYVCIKHSGERGTISVVES